jgi:CheY-like chemotaxis protein
MTFTHKSVLVVEDTNLHRIMLMDMLHDMGVGKVLEAKDGLEGMRMARFHKPDLVLLDLSMPILDGFETCEKIRMFASSVAMPIIVITGHERHEVLARIYDLGANDYFEKPFVVPEIATRVAFYLNLGDMLQKAQQFEQTMQRDLMIARAIQNNSLPSWTKVAEYLRGLNLDFGAFYQASSGLGGDSWSMEIMDNGDPCFFLFDVSGHGVNAAINNSYIISLQQSIFGRYRNIPAHSFTALDVLSALNTALYEHLQEGTFCAAACFKLDTATHVMEYAACGLPEFHLLDKKTGYIRLLPAKGIPLGILYEDFEPTVGSFTLESQHVLIAITDGLTEATTPYHKLKPEQYGNYLPGERLFSMCLKKIAKNTSPQFASKMVSDIIEEYRRIGYDLSHDDITMLLLQRQPLVKA